MTNFFSLIWHCFTDVTVPVFGFTFTAADLALGFFVVLFSIFVLKHLLWR